MELSCIHAKSYIGYRIDLFDQTVAILDHGLLGPVQHCAEGEVVAAGGPIMPPGPFPLQFDLRLAFYDVDEHGLYQGSNSQHFIWDADGQLYHAQ
jgi:hypothetical protein